MTDKQIIIDGVDVSGCESFCNSICCKVGFGDDASCKLFSDCNYKNWKRKEQECKELKNLNTRLDNQRETYWKGYQKLKQALTEIKEIAEKLQKDCEYWGDCNTCKYECCSKEFIKKISEVLDER